MIDYMMQHPTYASIIHLCIIIHTKPQYESAGNESQIELPKLKPLL
jgi:hypothetical protein